MDLASNLREQAEMLLTLFNNRVDKISSTKELLRCIRYASDKRLFNGDHLAIGIDGSMDYEEQIDMLLLYVNAIAYSARFKLDTNIEFDDRVEKNDIKISTAIPIWQSDLTNIIDRDDDEFEARYLIEKIPYSFMTMAELKVALDAIKSYQDLKLVILDRSLVRTYGSLTRELKSIRKGSPLIGIDTSYGKTSLLDIWLAYMLGDGSIYIPPRGSYARYAIIKELLNGEKRIEDLKIHDLDNQLSYLKKLDKQFDNLLLDRCDSIISLSDYAKDYWKRVSSITDNIVNSIFNSKRYPLLLNNKWLSISDLSALNLFLLYDIIGRALKHMFFLIGIIKDMNTTEFRRGVIPYLLSSDLGVASNDRSLFTILSSINTLKTPWRSIAYDAAFTTLIHDKGFKAARKAVFREQLFIRSYFQLRTYKHDQSIRSPVFLYDRLFYPIYDSPLIKEIDAEEWKKVEKIRLFIEDKDSIIDDLYLNILAKSDSNQVFEAYGHNYLLYLADKAAKFDVKHMRSMLKGIADLKRSNRFLSKFREQRYEEERRRVR